MGTLNGITRNLALTLLLSLLSLTAAAQYDVHFTHWWSVESFYNPAAMNRDGLLNLTGSFAAHMTGYEHAPTSMYFGADAALPTSRKEVAAGISLFNESIGLFTSSNMAANVSYMFFLGKGRLNIGMKAGLISQEFNGGGVHAEQGNDPAFPGQKEKGTAADLGAGIMYDRGPLQLGFGAMHLNSPHLEFGKSGGKRSEMDISPMLILSGQYNIQLENPLLSVQPGIFCMSDLAQTRVDMTVRGKYEYEQSLYYAGLTYSPGTSVTFLLGGKYKTVLIGYAYELNTQGAGYLNGSHDLLVSYGKEVDFFKRGRNAHKSIRYL